MIHDIEKPDLVAGSTDGFRELYSIVLVTVKPGRQVYNRRRLIFPVTSEFLTRQNLSGVFHS